MEFSSIILLWNHFLPQYISMDKVRFLLCVFFCYAFIGIFTALPGASLLALTVLHYIAFSTLAFTIVSCIVPCASSLVTSRRQSVLPFWTWLLSLDYNLQSALALQLLCLSALLASIIVYMVRPPTTADTTTMLPVPWFAAEILRNLVALLTYVVPSRLFRTSFIEARSELDVKTEFIKYINHEMRSPVSAVLSGLEVIERQFILTSEQREHVADLKATCLHAVETLNDLLLFEEIGRSSIAMHVSAMDPIACFNRIFRSYHMKDSRVTVRTSIADGNTDINVVCVKLDKPKIQQALHALIEPSAGQPDFSGTVDITYSLIEQTAPGRHTLRYSRSKVLPYGETDRAFRITISCSYKGAVSLLDLNNDPDELQFKRLGHDDNDGTAFRLWLAKQLITLHGATIIFDQEHDGCVVYHIDFPTTTECDVNPLSESSVMVHDSSRGTPNPVSRFSLVTPIAVPRLRGSGVETSLSVSQGRFFADSPSVSPPLSFLVVDDSSMVRKMTMKLLESMGCAITEASDGEVAVQIIRSGKKFDVILMDNEMPRMQGSQATKIIRDELRFKGLIVGVTGNALDADLRDFRASGADEIIIKPLTLATLRKTLKVLQKVHQLRLESVESVKEDLGIA